MTAPAYLRMAALAGLLFVAISVGQGAERVIFDTDVGGDVDDAGALAVLHGLAASGEIEILAIGVTNAHRNTVPYLRAVNSWYGRPAIPLGTPSGRPPLSRDKYLAGVAGESGPATSRDAVGLYREVLAAQPDGSVILVTVGPPTNIARLLESGPDAASPLTGRELVRRKVKFYAAGGNGNGKLPAGRCGFNYEQDPAAARVELANFPEEIPMVFAGGSGRRVKTGDAFRAAPRDHPIRRSYEAYFGSREKMDRASWDQLRVLYACRPATRAWFETSPPGAITLDDHLDLHWVATPGRNQAYALVRDEEAVRRQITDLMMHERAAVGDQPTGLR